MATTPSYLKPFPLIKPSTKFQTFINSNSTYNINTNNFIKMYKKDSNLRCIQCVTNSRKCSSITKLEQENGNEEEEEEEERKNQFIDTFVAGGGILGLLLLTTTFESDSALAASGGRIGGKSFSSSSSSSSRSSSSSWGSSESRSSSLWSSPSDSYHTSTSYAFAPLRVLGFVVCNFEFCLFIFYVTMIGIAVVASWMKEVFSPSPRSGDHSLRHQTSIPIRHQTSVIKLQVCLLGMARSLKRDLEQLAEVADTSSSEGLNYILKEATLSLLQHPDFCISGYSSVHSKQSLEDGEKLFDYFSIEERGKFDEETLSNVNNIKRKTGTRRQSKIGSKNEYIVMTILVAAAGSQDLPIISSNADLKDALQKLGSISSKQTLAVEVLWTPQEENDTLSEQELLMKYPFLRPLHWTNLHDTDIKQIAITHKIREEKKKTTKH